MKKAVCDLCERSLNVGCINISYKVKATKRFFDGWSSVYTAPIDVCDRCVEKIKKLVNEDVARLCGCGYAAECAVHCNHELKFCPGPAFEHEAVNDLVGSNEEPK
jgi:hypothetical protein